MQNTQRGIAVSMVVLIVAALSLAAGGAYVATSDEVNLTGEGSIFGEYGESYVESEANDSATVDLDIDGTADIMQNGDTESEANMGVETEADADVNVDVYADSSADLKADSSTRFWTKLGF